MSDLEAQFAALLRDFTAKIAAVVREHALESAHAALERVGRVSAKPGRRGSTPSTRGPRAASKNTRAASDEAFDAEAVKPQVVSYLLANPGLRVDQLGERLSLSTDKLKPLVKKLVADRMLRAEGNTRGRRYFAAKGATSATARKAKAKPARKRSKKR